MHLPDTELSRKIIGVAFKVYNTLGYGYKEKDYQQALGEEFKTLGLKFQKELYSNLKYNNIR